MGGVRTALRGAVVLGIVVGVLSTASAAWAVSVRDDSLFGYEEAWVPPSLRPGQNGLWVQELQASLNDGGFRAGLVNGSYGRTTVQAVRMFQRLHGLPQTGVFTAELWSVLDAGMPFPLTRGEPDRIEIDLENQVLSLIESDEMTAVLPVSTASGRRYEDWAGRLVRSVTPEGRYALYRSIRGWHESYLGEMYNPFYFEGGYAIHGSPSVPNYPASHGCVRVRINDMKYLREILDLGLPVYVYGKSQTRDEVMAAAPVRHPYDLIARFVAASV